MKKLMLFIAMISFGITACKSTKDNVQVDDNVETRSDRKEGKKGDKSRLSPDQMIAQMDADKDGRLSRSEVKGPLAKGFDKIDTNSDDYLSLEELKNAPKPQRGQRGGRG